MDLLGFVVNELQWRALGLFALFLLAIGTAAWLVYRRFQPRKPSHEDMSFLEHLEELRLRILRSGLIVLLWSIVFLGLRIERTDLNGFSIPTPVPALYDTIASRVYQWIVAEVVPSHVEIIVTSPAEAVGAQFQVGLLLAVIVSFPFILYEAWAFFSPGLGSREQRFLKQSVPAALALFVVGCAFGFKLVVPLLFSVLYGFAPPLGAHTFLAAGTLVGTVTALVLLFGLSFELPLVMAGLVRVGLLEPESYLRKWRHATIGIFIVAAIVTDPTLTSQLIVGALLLVLYWGGVALSFLMRSPQSAPTYRAAKG